MDGDLAKIAFRCYIDDLIANVDRYDEWGADPELARTRARARGRVYRKDHREDRQERSTAKRTESRLHKLRQLVKDKDQ